MDDHSADGHDVPADGGAPLPTMMLRGAMRRCPWCGDRRAFYRTFFAKQERCQGCNLSWRRGDVGFELGAMTANVIVSMGLIVIGAAITIVLTTPDIPVLEIVIGLIVAGLILPVVVYPMSYTLWQALDLKMRPPTVGDFVEAPRVSPAAPDAAAPSTDPVDPD
jgi:uncharacterized protein (DUF983 family)